MNGKTGSEEEQIIVDARFLSEEYLPERFLGRDEQKRLLETCLSPMFQGQAPLNAWLHGPAGSGKTALARALAERVHGAAPGRVAVYVNCWEKQSTYQVLQAMTEALQILGAEAQDTNVKLDRIRRRLGSKPAVIILDDIDRIAPKERDHVLHTLLTLPQTGLICIARDRKTLFTLEERVRSRLHPMVIALSRYTAAELRDIVLERAMRALRPGVWSNDVLVELARQASGDARAAIQGLRQAAAATQSAGRQRLKMQELPGCLEEIRNARREERIAQLSSHERLIYRLALNVAPILTTDLRRRYEQACRRKDMQPVARRTFSKYVKSLGIQGLVTVEEGAFGAKGKLLGLPCTRKDRQ